MLATSSVTYIALPLKIGMTMNTFLFKHRALHQWLLLFLLSMSITLLKTQSAFLVDITYLESAVAKGAVCLDGTPPAYNFDKGFGGGVNNWLLHLEGGGWCDSVASCLGRSKGYLGSSAKMTKLVYFSGVLSNESQFNPDFYNWNRVKIRYCDGASFTGDIEEVDPDTKLYYRGARIFRTVIDELLEKGMKNAENAILSGCSAGGLASIHHCDNFKSLLPRNTKVKCFADAGFFINSKDVSGARSFQDFYDGVVTTHGSAKNLPKSCTSKMKPSLCFFPENVAHRIETPLFLVNSPIDSWQINNILAPDVSDPQSQWKACKTDISKCSASELQRIRGFESDFKRALTGLGNSKSRGYFINSCYLHCETEQQEFWYKSDSPMLKNKTIANAAGDWFHDRSPFQEIDCPYPCDKTCPGSTHARIYGDINL